MPRTRAVRRLRDRHEPCGRDHAADQMVRPHVAIITTVAPVHLEFFGSLEAIADAKAEIFSASSPAARRCSIATIASSTRCRARRGAGVRASSLRRACEARRARDQVALTASARACSASVLGDESSTSSARRASTWCCNARACWPRRRSWAPILRARRWRSPARAAPKGSGARIGSPARRPLVLIDESYNANPASMRAALALSARRRPGRAGRRSPCSATCWNWARRARRSTPASPRRLRKPRRSGFFCGPLMRTCGRLSTTRRGGYAEHVSGWSRCSRPCRWRRSYGQRVERRMGPSSRRCEGAFPRKGDG